MVGGGGWVVVEGGRRVQSSSDLVRNKTSDPATGRGLEVQAFRELLQESEQQDRASVVSLSQVVSGVGKRRWRLFR